MVVLAAASRSVDRGLLPWMVGRPTHQRGGQSRFRVRNVVVSGTAAPGEIAWEADMVGVISLRRLAISRFR